MKNEEELKLLAQTVLEMSELIIAVDFEIYGDDWLRAIEVAQNIQNLNTEYLNDR